MKNTLFLYLFLYAFTIQAQALSDKNFRIYSTKDKKEVNLKEIVQVAKEYDVIFYGEEHNDSVTHYLEYQVLEGLHNAYPGSVALSMEMFERDCQVIMNEYLGGYIRERNFKKDARVWSNYRDYRPLVEYAKDKKLSVVCANAPGRYSNLAGRKGQKELALLPAESKQWFAPVPYDTASGAYYNKLMGMSGHDTGKKDSSIKAPVNMGMPGFSLNQAQSLWDATMGYSIYQYLQKNKNKKVLHVNGRFHSDEGFAAVSQLKKYDPKLRILIISTGTAENGFNAINWDEYRQNGDFIILTDPAVPKTYKE